MIDFAGKRISCVNDFSIYMRCKTKFKAIKFHVKLKLAQLQLMLMHRAFSNTNNINLLSEMMTWIK